MKFFNSYQRLGIDFLAISQVAIFAPQVFTTSLATNKPP